MTAFHPVSGGQSQYRDASGQSLANLRVASRSVDGARCPLDKASLELPGRGVPPPRASPRCAVRPGTVNSTPRVWVRARCRLCDSERLVTVLDLGATPPCEKILAPGDLDLPEPTFPLRIRLCEDCLLLQLTGSIMPEDTASEYPYYSSFSDARVRRAKNFVRDAVKRLGLSKKSFVAEVASNDGYLLQHVVAAGVPCLGIEPSINVGLTGRERGVPTVSALLDEALARAIRAEHGPAELVVANNVYARTSDLLGFTRSLRVLLADDGWLSIEVHHALRLVQEVQFEGINHEHYQYFTLLSATRALATAGLAVVDAEILPTDVGTLHIWARPGRAAAPPSEGVVEVLRLEKAAGLHRVDGYLQCRVEEKRVVGYGAAGMGNALLNYCGIRSDLLEYTVDRDPYKRGRFTPGVRVPIHDPERIAQDRPDVVVALSWDLETDLSRQLDYIHEWGGRLVFPPTLPSPAMSIPNSNGVNCYE
jgi:hypothetical protein